MNITKNKPAFAKIKLPERNVLIYAAVCLLVVIVFAVLSFRDDSIPETKDTTYGIDVARYQGTIDWEAVSQSGVDFVMVRLGYRSVTDGTIYEDTNARYNMQEARKYDIKIGGYFFSTAVSVEEAVAEAQWVAEIVSQYPITYPIAYDCELFNQEYSRQYGLSAAERTDIALAFLMEIENQGYQGMFYASKNDLEENEYWDVDRLQDYKIWVAQYPGDVNPETDASSYSGTHSMWQYTRDGMVSGIDQSVDMNVAYFGYDGIADPKNKTAPEEVEADPEALMSFDEVNEQVTAKDAVNLRDIPSQGEEAAVLYQLQNGEIATRTGISDSGWSRVEMDGKVYYAVSSYLTTDLYYVPYDTEDDGIETVFTPVNEQVTPKIAVNLRNIPSVEHKDSQVVVKISNGEVITRTGINEDVGWSRVVYNGQTLYCVSSYLEPAK